MLSSILARITGSAIPVRLIGLAAAGLAIAASVTYHVTTTARLETAVAQAQANHAEALADVARRDVAIAELEHAITSQNAAVNQLREDGQARSKRASDAARRELDRPASPMPADIAALNAWIRSSTAGDTK